MIVKKSLRVQDCTRKAFALNYLLCSGKTKLNFPKIPCNTINVVQEANAFKPLSGVAGLPAGVLQQTSRLLM